MATLPSSDFEFPRGKPLPKKSQGAKAAPARATDKYREPEEFVEDIEEEITPKVEVKDKPSSDTAPEYEEEELLRIFDEILFSNEYTESYNIRGRMEVTFRTRTAKEVQDIDRNLDSLGASLVSTVENIRSFNHLERALVTYNGKDLSTMKSTEKSGFVQSLPGPIIGALLLTLAKFDHKVGMACKVGEQNF